MEEVQQQHPSKVLLQFYAERRGTSMLEVYRTYLKSTLNVNISHGSLAVLDDELLGEFFQMGDCSKPPRFLDFENLVDLSRLERCLDARLVIYMADRSRKRRRYYDKRIYDLLIPGRDALPVDHFLLEAEVVKSGRRNKVWRLSPMPPAEVALLPSPRELESHFMQASALGSPCLVGALRRLLLPVEEEEEVEQQPRCDSLLSLLTTDVSELYRAVGEQPFLLVSHVHTTTRMRKKDSSDFFATLTVVTDPEERKQTLRKMAVVSVTVDGYLYLMKEAQAKELLKLAPGLSANFKRLPFPNVAAGEQVCSQQQQQQQQQDGCRCRACVSMENFAANMDRFGPSRLYRTALTAIDLLKVLALDTPENLEALDEASMLSLSSIDLESLTVKLESQPVGLEAQHGFSRVGLSSVPLKGHRFAKQLPVLLGIYDAFDERLGLDCEILSLPSLEVGEAQAYCVFADRLLELLEARKARCKALKQELLQPLLEELARYRVAHDLFFESEGLSAAAASDEDEEPKKKKKKKKKKVVDPATQVWQGGLWGKLEGRLLRLIDSYDVTAFNGANYDFPLLVTHLMTRARSKNLNTRLYMQREGTSVPSFQIGRIKFFEAGKLMAPSYSLRSLAKMTNIDMEKGLFPFDLWTSMSFLDQPKLPPDAASWKSQLQGGGNSQAGPSQLEIDEVLALYERKGFKNVLEYLQYYLTLDTKILLRCMAALIRQYFLVTGVHVLEAHTYTISGYSFMSSQTYLMRRKSVGQFSVNNMLLYSILYQGTVGGNTQIFRHVAGERADYSSYLEMAEEMAAKANLPPPKLEDLIAINAHVLGKGEGKKPSVVGCLDAHSLYPSASGSASCSSSSSATSSSSSSSRALARSGSSGRA